MEFKGIPVAKTSALCSRQDYSIRHYEKCFWKDVKDTKISSLYTKWAREVCKPVAPTLEQSYPHGIWHMVHENAEAEGSNSAPGHLRRLLKQ